jgi:hypothetical protein
LTFDLRPSPVLIGRFADVFGRVGLVLLTPSSFKGCADGVN